ncbi:MAG: diacylglycerol/lipid kinase family protein, partial [Rudaea sp.]
MRKTLVILNPASRRGHAAEYWPEVEAELRAAGVEFDLARTHQSLHAVQLAWEAPNEGYEQVVAMGGDGLVHEVINGLLRASGESETLPLGIIPFGNGNDFIKMIPPPCAVGENHDDWRAAIRRIAGEATTFYDVGRIAGD